MGASDPTVLEYAARENRIVLSHDENTLIYFAYERVRQELPMPGLIEVPLGLATNLAAEDIILLAECSRDGEWDNQVIFLPLT